MSQIPTRVNMSSLAISILLVELGLIDIILTNNCLLKWQILWYTQRFECIGTPNQ